LHCGMYPAGKVAISRHLVTPGFPPVWPYCQQAQCGHWHSLKWSIADLLTSSHPQMSASHLLGLQVRANGPSCLVCYHRRSSVYPDVKTDPSVSILTFPVVGLMASQAVRSSRTFGDICHLNLMSQFLIIWAWASSTNEVVPVFCSIVWSTISCTLFQIRKWIRSQRRDLM
jgi:hypothetical protein